MLSINDMSSNQKSGLILDEELGDGWTYPWEKLNDLGFDNLWVDANKQSSPGILRCLSIILNQHIVSILVVGLLLLVTLLIYWYRWVNDSLST